MDCKSMAVATIDVLSHNYCSILAFGCLSVSITENGQIASKQYKMFLVSLLIFHIFRGN